MLWLEENRERLTAEAKNIGEKSYMRLGGEEWKAVVDKSKWEEMAKEDKERIQDELAESPAPVKKAKPTTTDDKTKSGAKGATKKK